MLLNDLRYSARMLRKSPLFTLAIVLTVALGIGANTAIFSFVNAVMLRPLPFHQPDRLVWVAERNDKLRMPTFAASVLNYVSWRKQQATFEQMGAVGFANFNLTGRGAPEQFTGGTLTLGVFAVCALVIAAIGIYGVLAYSVNQRTQEIGLRMALGAPAGLVLRLIVREGMTVGAIGIAAGIAGALAISRVLASLVFETPVRDPLTFVIVAAALAFVALMACVIPARKASRVDPIVALRDE